MSIIIVERGQFINRYENEGSRTVAKYAFKKWDAFLKARNILEPDMFHQFRNEPSKNERYIFLDQFVQFCQVYTPTRKAYFSFIKSWIKYNDVDLRDDKIKEYVRFPKAERERPKGIDRNVIQRFLEECNPFYKGIFLILSCTGMRGRSEFLNMRRSWIDFGSKPVSITIPAKFSKTKQERMTWVTPEAERYLRQMAEAKKPDEKICSLTYGGMYEYFKARRIKLGLLDRTASGGYHFRPHKFRGYAENKMSKAVGEEFAHATVGHGNYLGQYWAGGTTDEEAAKDYESAIPELTINPSQKLQDENERLKTRNEMVDTRLQKIEDMLERMKYTGMLKAS